VARIGQRLAAGSRARGWKFSFELVEADMANAFALPDGSIFVTQPLLDLCDGDEAEAAFFLGHEMGHVILRHAAEKYAVDAVLTATRGGALANKLLGTGYSREQEREADREGVRLAAEAGFEPAGAIRALRKLGAASPEAGAFAGYLSTHPSTADRIRDVEEFVAQSGADA